MSGKEVTGESGAGGERSLGDDRPTDETPAHFSGEHLDGQALIDAATAPTIPMRRPDNSRTDEHDGGGQSPPGAGAPAAKATPAAQPSTMPPPGSFRLSIGFPNVAGGKPYDEGKRVVLRSPSISGLASDRYGLTILSIDGLAEAGLEHDIDGDFVRIHGTTAQAGDHRLRVFFRVRHPDLPDINAHDEFTLTVNPDPRSLWRDLEPDSALPFQKPHTAIGRLATPAAVLVAASRRGRSHAHEGSFRDDDFTLGFDEASGWHYMVVADGAGSAKLSRRGSAVACEAVHEPLRTHFASTLGPAFTEAVLRYKLDPAAASEQAIRLALYTALGATGLAARKAVEREATATGAALRDFSTTFLLTICRRYDVGWFSAAFSVGDGGVGVYGRASGVVPLSRADSGEYAGQTRFLTMAEVWQDSQDVVERIGFHLAPKLTAVVAMTDGVSDPKFETDAKFADAACWHLVWEELAAAGVDARDGRAAERLLEWLGFWSVGNHDDRTLAALLPL